MLTSYSMYKKLTRHIILLFGALAISLTMSCNDRQAITKLDPPENSNIVFIGNTFAERLQYNNYFETMLYQSFPERNLKVRNLAWSADEITLRPRPLGFGTLDDHLQQQKADIIFAFFGLNEAFKGLDSVSNFKEDLHAFLSHLTTQSYNGRNSPQVILVSPIAHEALGGFLPDPKAQNINLEAYSKEMKKVASELDIPFIDLFTPSKNLMDA